MKAEHRFSIAAPLDVYTARAAARALVIDSGYHAVLAHEIALHVSELGTSALKRGASGEIVLSIASSGVHVVMREYASLAVPLDKIQ